MSEEQPKDEPKAETGEAPTKSLVDPSKTPEETWKNIVQGFGLSRTPEDVERGKQYDKERRERDEEDHQRRIREFKEELKLHYDSIGEHDAERAVTAELNASVRMRQETASIVLAALIGTERGMKPVTDGEIVVRAVHLTDSLIAELRKGLKVVSEFDDEEAP